VAEPLLATDDITVTIEGDTDNSVRVDPVTGTIETDTEDGGMVVHFNANQQAGTQATDDPKEFYKNLCETVGDDRLGTICEELIEQIQTDDNSRKEMLDIRARGLGLMGFKLEQPKSGVGDSASSQDGMSVVTNPLLADGCLRAWANAQAELLPADGPCKVEDWDTNETQANEQLAEDFERDMNFWLVEIATEYVPDTQHMLLWGTIFGGSGIKKVYQNPRLNRPCSESVDVKDFIVSDTTKDLKTCERVTHQITIRPSEMKRLQMKKYYRDIPLQPATAQAPDAVSQRIADQQGTLATPSARPEDMPYTLWETQCELNLPDFAPKEFGERGIALPYLVTIEKDSRTILSIRRDWKPEDEDCRRKQMYVKYPYIPGPGFYGTGLLNVLGNSSAAMTAAWRLALDAAMYGIFPAGLISDECNRQKSSVIRPAPGELSPIQTNGKPIGDMVGPLPWAAGKGQADMMALLDKITQQTKSLGGAIEIPVKEGVKDIPVGTMLAYIEQAAQIMLAAHKGMHTAQSEELTLIADLFRENPESFWKGNKKWKNSWNEQRLFLALNVCTLKPRSDPNVPSHVHRLMKAVGLIQLLEIPAFASLLSPAGILDRVLRAMKEDPTGIRVSPPPPSGQPSPDELTAAAKLKEADNKGQKVQVDAAKIAVDAKNRERELAGEETIERERLAQTAITHASDNKKAAVDSVHKASTHGLAVAQAAHDAVIDHGELAIKAHEATKPEPPPTDGGT
jgi:hypothetical protein